jgi:hypothetical protein
MLAGHAASNRIRHLGPAEVAEHYFAVVDVVTRRDTDAARLRGKGVGKVVVI